MEKKKHSILIVLVPVLLIGAVIAGWYYLRTWPLRFQGQLDDFFGKDNWEVISEDTKESLMYDKNITIRDAAWSSEEIPGKFHEWDISFTNRNGDTEVWTISDHTMKINHDKYWLLSPDRYSAKQSLGQELMDISFSMAGEQVHKKSSRLYCQALKQTALLWTSPTGAVGRTRNCMTNCWMHHGSPRTM